MKSGQVKSSYTKSNLEKKIELPLSQIEILWVILIIFKIDTIEIIST